MWSGSGKVGQSMFQDTDRCLCLLAALVLVAPRTRTRLGDRSFDVLSFYNNNNTEDDIYSAVVMTTGHCESSLGSSAADPQTKPPDLGCDCEATCRLLSSTTAVAIVY